MSSFDKSVVTGVLVQNSEGKFLLVKKPDDVGPYAGMYLPPGGGIDDGENADDAALRELYEETGVRVKNLKRALGNDDTLEVIEWFSPEELKTLPLSPPVEKLLKHLGHLD